LLIGLWPQVAIESIQMDTNRLVQVYETLPAQVAAQSSDLNLPLTSTTLPTSPNLEATR
jgi:hypothetical protein